MLLWTEVLAGADGLGRDFDLFLMTGPTDVQSFFLRRAHPATDWDLLSALDQWAQKHNISASDRKQFLTYYGMKASGSFSMGSHDKWNAFVRINQARREKLGVAAQIPVYYDGRSLDPAEMEAPVSTGYEGPCAPVE